MCGVAFTPRTRALCALVPLAFLFLASVLPGRAGADRRNPLEGQPSIRHRLELRAERFEIEPFVGFTLLQDFNNTVMGGAKLQYHLFDWLAIGAVFGGGTSIGTGLKSQILGTLDDTMTRGGPPKTRAEQAMNKINWMGAFQAEFVPVGGKLSLFSKAFLNFDFYIDAGAGVVGLANSLPSQPSDCSSKAMSNDFGCNDGIKIGPSVGAGVHLFFNDWIALDLAYRATIIKDNPAGRDVNGDKSVNDDDLSWGAKNFVTIGAAFYLPSKAAISR
jgi:outer membrane beta-barrel protein